MTVIAMTATGPKRRKRKRKSPKRSGFLPASPAMKSLQNRPKRKRPSRRAAMTKTSRSLRNPKSNEDWERHRGACKKRIHSQLPPKLLKNRKSKKHPRPRWILFSNSEVLPTSNQQHKTIAGPLGTMVSQHQRRKQPRNSLLYRSSQLRSQCRAKASYLN